MKITISQTFDSSVTVDEICSAFLKTKGLSGKSEIQSFLSPAHPSLLTLKNFYSDTDVFSKKWKPFISLLRKIKKAGSAIVVYTDYDADGVTGGAIMWETLHKLGFNVMPYVPDRKKEGYGFSEQGILHVKELHNPALIISVDHGIVAHEQITFAKKLNIPIVVTDHHQMQKHEPNDALAVFHLTELSGSGVAYFVAKEISTKFHDGHLSEFENDYVGFAAIGTIADMVPLTGASRSIAWHGLKAIQNSVRYGLRRLIKEAGLDGKTITPYEIGFVIAPRINAFGRLEHALDALRLLCTNSFGRANQLASRAGSINKTRQNLVARAQRKADVLAKDDDHIIIVRDDDWEEGIIGLVAGRLMKTYWRPVIVLTKSDGHAKASVRSIPGVDITKFLTSKELRPLLMDVGGHAAAAGFSIELNNIEEFTRNAIKKANKEISEEMLLPEITVDMMLPISVVTVELARQLSKFEPFGMGNPQPVFLSEAVVQDIQLLGKKKEYTKLLLSDNYSNVEVMFFEKLNSKPSSNQSQVKKGSKVRIVYNVSINMWGGKERLSAIGKYIEVM